jgi:hypothetical protein
MHHKIKLALVATVCFLGSLAAMECPAPDNESECDLLDSISKSEHPYEARAVQLISRQFLASKAKIRARLEILARTAKPKPEDHPLIAPWRLQAKGPEDYPEKDVIPVWKLLEKNVAILAQILFAHHQSKLPVEELLDTAESAVSIPEHIILFRSVRKNFITTFSQSMLCYICQNAFCHACKPMQSRETDLQHEAFQKAVKVALQELSKLIRSCIRFLCYSLNDLKFPIHIADTLEDHDVTKLKELSKKSLSEHMQQKSNNIEQALHLAASDVHNRLCKTQGIQRITCILTEISLIFAEWAACDLRVWNK